jgi:hypothetical protein
MSENVTYAGLAQSLFDGLVIKSVKSIQLHVNLDSFILYIV